MNSISTEAAEVKLEKVEVKESKPRKIIVVSKTGSDHTFADKNNHDYAFNLLNMKVVLDGCGEGKHSEVGTRVFSQLFARRVKEYIEKGESINCDNFVEVVDSVFKKMLELCSDTSFVFQNYLFTILVCFELEDEFVVFSCGDGFIIKETKEGISFEKLDDGEYPAYYAYNFVEDKEHLKAHKEGVGFNVAHFSKSEYTNVGVATDGLRYSENLIDIEKARMMQILHDGGPGIEKLINKNNKHGMFHDDISICF